jgi:hypothetical protein
MCRSSGCSELSAIYGKENILACDAVVFWVMMPCGLVGDMNFSEEYTAFIVRVVTLVHPKEGAICSSKTFIPTCQLYFRPEEGKSMFFRNGDTEVLHCRVSFTFSCIPP